MFILALRDAFFQVNLPVLGRENTLKIRFQDQTKASCLEQSAVFVIQPFGAFNVTRYLTLTLLKWKIW